MAHTMPFNLIFGNKVSLIQVNSSTAATQACHIHPISLSLRKPIKISQRNIMRHEPKIYGYEPETKLQASSSLP
jgi:hypothetical protein